MRATGHNDMGLLQGAAPSMATGAMVLLHGRGGLAEDILQLGEELDLPNVTLFAPQAPSHTWYPNSFVAPIASNEPWLSAALDNVGMVVEQCVALGLSRERIAITGFSQGACLACEFVARNPARYAGLLAFTGGLIGPPGADLRHEGSLQETPVLLSSGEPDPHVPWSRVQETAQEFGRMRAAVRLEKHSNRPHTIIPTELALARDFLEPVLNRQNRP